MSDWWFMLMLFGVSYISGLIAWGGYHLDNLKDARRRRLAEDSPSFWRGTMRISARRVLVTPFWPLALIWEAGKLGVSVTSELLEDAELKKSFSSGIIEEEEGQLSLPPPPEKAVIRHE